MTMLVDVVASLGITLGPYHAEHSTQPASVRLYAWRCSADRHGADDRDTPDADARPA